MYQYANGFIDAIEKVRQLAYEESERLAKLFLIVPQREAFMKRYDIASVALTEFSKLIKDLSPDEN